MGFWVFSLAVKCQINKLAVVDLASSLWWRLFGCDGSTVQRVQFRSAGSVCAHCQRGWQRCSVFASVSDCLVCAHFASWPHVSHRSFRIFGFNLQFLCADVHLKYGLRLWTDVFRCVCVEGWVCVCVCIVTTVLTFAPPAVDCLLMCWCRILTETDILVWWCWTNNSN